MIRMLVLADDLTGAADCGVACAGCGMRTVVALDDFRDCDADVVAIDANTRASEPQEAAAVMERLIRAHAPGDEWLIYKKIDSTLRGNVAAELKAVLTARRAALGGGSQIVAVFAPAFPATGRTTVGGRQLVNGLPLSESDLWQHERKPPPSSIMEIVGKAGLRSVLVELSAIRGNNLRETMTELAREADVLACDAESEEDLRAIADASMALGRGTIWVGSAGLAYHLPRAAGQDREPSAPQLPVASGPILFVAGSASIVSGRQALLLESWPDVISVRIAPGVLRAGEDLPEWRAHRAALERAFSAGVDVLVTVGADEPIEFAQEPLLAGALGEMVRPFSNAVGALVVTGGETARAVFRAWGITRLQILGEVEPGLPYSIAAGWRRSLPVLTKAGGFGKPETLLHCREFLRATGRGSELQSSLSRGRD
ncbi:MAG TPA: four-carbon acid sugar kinase family protein [Terracidiphilus sp.]|nr:four-carbon acid sugar kinase family protein [Terracidiphilus sp.]